MGFSTNDSIPPICRLAQQTHLNLKKYSLYMSKNPVNANIEGVGLRTFKK